MLPLFKTNLALFNNILCQLSHFAAGIWSVHYDLSTKQNILRQDFSVLESEMAHIRLLFEL